MYHKSKHQCFQRPPFWPQERCPSKQNGWTRYWIHFCMLRPQKDLCKSLEQLSWTVEPVGYNSLVQHIVARRVEQTELSDWAVLTLPQQIVILPTSQLTLDCRLKWFKTEAMTVTFSAVDFQFEFASYIITVADSHIYNYKIILGLNLLLSYADSFILFAEDQWFDMLISTRK